MMSIYERETKEFVETVSETLMNYALYDLVKDMDSESEFNHFAAEMIQIIDNR